MRGKEKSPFLQQSPPSPEARELFLYGPSRRTARKGPFVGSVSIHKLAAETETEEDAGSEEKLVKRDGEIVDQLD